MNRNEIFKCGIDFFAPGPAVRFYFTAGFDFFPL